MGKGSEGKMEVTDYYLSVHFGICHGPVDSLNRIVVKEKEAWRGLASAPGAFPVYQPGLFGGQKKEGGVGGAVEWLPGRDDQIMPAYLAARFRRGPDSMPAYRGIASMFMTGGAYGGGFGGTGKGMTFEQLIKFVQAAQSGPSFGMGDIAVDGPGGFYWGSNNPYLGETWANVTAIVRSLSAPYAAIPNLVPEAIIGLPKEEEPPEDDEDDDEAPTVPDAENADPLNGYYIGALPDEASFIRTKYGYRGTQDSVDNDPTYTRRLFDVENRDKLKIGGLVYRNYGNDCNPANIIFECMTNQAWGMGAPTSSFAMPVWEAAAKKLFDEGFGLSMMWAQQATIEDFVTEVLDHIQATLFINPRTGLFELKLIRNDYDLDQCRVLTPDNCTMTSFQRKAWGETVNEIVVTWTNPENEGESTVSMQDLANIGVQGAVVSDSRNYYGIRNAALAMRVAARDLRTASAPTASFDAEIDRSGWDIKPGEVVRVQWPEEGVADVAFRAMSVDYGRIGQSTVKVKLVEEIFSLPQQGYTMPGPPRPVVTDFAAEPLDYLRGLTIPYQLAARFGAAEGRAYPESGVMLLGASDNIAIERFQLVTKVTAPNGSTEDKGVGDFGVTTHFKLSAALPLEFSSKIKAFSALTRAGGQPTPGGLLIIGDKDADHEIAMLESFSETEGYTFSRGMLDTVPKAWPTGTPGWIIEFAVYNSVDPMIRAANVKTDYKVLPATSTETLDIEEAQPFSFTPSERFYQPARPANVTVGGQRIERVYTSKPSTIPVAWANRNRLREDAVFKRWTEGSVDPEAGQTTTIRVFDADGGKVAEHTGLTGTSFDLPTTDLSGSLRVVLSSSRDGFESLQAFAVKLVLPYQAGYGYGYGEKYGE